MTISADQQLPVADQPAAVSQPQRVIVALPCYTHAVHSSCLLSLIRLDRLLRQNGIEMDIITDNGSVYVEHSRNRLATYFLNSSTADALLFVDDDVEFNEEAVLKMLRSGVDVVGGLYPYKAYFWKDPGNKTMRTLQYVVKAEAPIPADPSSSELVEVEGVGTGLLLITRAALERLKPTTRVYKDSRTRADMYEFFELSIDDDVMWGEDFKFCKKWRAIGGRVYVASWAMCAHWGMHGFGLEKFTVA